MRTTFIITGLSFTFIFLGSVAPSALAESVPTVQPNDGFLEQAPATWMDASPIPSPLYPTLTQIIRAADLMVHEEDTLKLGSPEYQNAHRLLLSQLKMMQRQLHFNPVDLAQFNGSTHPARFITDQTPQSSDVAINEPATYVDTTSKATGYHTYTGNVPTRRSIIVASEDRTLLHTLSFMQ